MDTEDVGAYGAFVGRLRGGAQGRPPQGAGLRGDHGEPRRRRDGRRRRRRRRGPHLHDGLRLPLVRVGPRARRRRWTVSTATSGTCVWSLDLYEAAGVPVERTLLGCPSTGWPGRSTATSPTRRQTGDGDGVGPRRAPERHPGPVDRTDARTGRGRSTSTTCRARRERQEGLAGRVRGFARTLKPKLGLADDRGLAGAGFWAIGFERGQPATTKLINRFRAGNLAD